MLLENAQQAGNDMQIRLLQETKVDAQRLLDTCSQALKEDGFLLSSTNHLAIQTCLKNLEETIEQHDRDHIILKIQELQTITTDFAAKRMTHHVSKVLQGERLCDIEAKISPNRQAHAS